MRPVLGALSALSAFSAFSALPAQGDATSGRAAAESAAARRSAERAARDFELRRLRLLPNIPSSGSAPGDVIIGRYRYAAGEADDLKPPPAEPPAIADARRALLRTLDSTSRVAPADAWVRSRLVWYSIEAGDTVAATAAARNCRDDEVPWWCDALLGLALHVSHDFVNAERAFDRALAAMPASTRCRWTDIREVVDGTLDKLLRSTSCEHRDTLDARLWWLADPFHSIEGNELRSEHLARHTFAVLHDRWRPSHPLGWGDDMREIILRYAWPVAWSRDRVSERSATQAGFSMAITGHEPNPAYDYFPDAEAVESPYDVSDANWRPKRDRATAHYAHPFAAPLRPLRHQIARFRRGDSLLIVAAWNASDDTLFTRAPGHAAAVASTAGGPVRFIERSDIAGANGGLLVRVPNAAYVASLELFASDSRAAARTRAGMHAFRLTSEIAVSDILLLEPGPQPRSFAEALDRLLPEARLDADRRVTLYWEVYGMDAALPPRVAVSVARVHASRGRRLAEKLGLRDRPRTVEIQWEADAPAEESTAASVTLDLRDRPTGTWRVSITVDGDSRGRATTTRDLIIDNR